MAVVRRSEIAGNGHLVEVLDDTGAAVAVAGDFLAHLAARGCSPNTVLAYGHDCATCGASSALRDWGGTR